MSIILDLAILFGLVGGILWSMRRGSLRNLVSIGIVFPSTLFAALLYNPLINAFTASLGNPSSGQTAGAIVFGGLMIVFVVGLEAVVHRNYPGLRTGRSKLGVWDNILAAFFGLIWTMFVISLVLLTFEYGSRSIGGAMTAVGEWITQSFLTPIFRTFFSVPLVPIRLLFQGNMPQVLLYSQQIFLEDVVIDWQHFSNAGAFQTASRSANWTVSVTGSVSGPLGSVTASNVSGLSGVETLRFASPLALHGTEAFAVKIFVKGNTVGNNTGLDALALNGVIIAAPESFRLTIAPTVSGFDLAWNSRPGVLYNVRSSLELSGAVSNWTVAAGGIVATPPTNTRSVSNSAPTRGEPLVSLTADLAHGFGVGIGDTISVNVLGQELTARIAALRLVEWSTLELNFALLFAPGLLEDAPQTHLAAIHVPPEDETAVFRAVSQTFPNVSVISTREVLTNVTRTLERIGAAFTAMAALVLLSGLLVLAGAGSADQHRRIHDAVIFKVCGATRRDILSAFAAEFLLLGLCAGVLSAVVGSLAAWGILQGLMDTPFSLDPLALLATLTTGLLATLLLGLLGTWKALGQKPAALLREE